MEAAEVYEYKGYTIEVYRDEYPTDPRGWDNLTHIWCWHRRYNLGDEAPVLGDVGSWEEVEEYIHETEDILHISPIYMYDHSGVGVSLSDARYPFNCPWDAGQIGYIFVTKDAVRENWSLQRISAKRKSQALDLLHAEFDEWAAYVSGNVWGYVIKDKYGDDADSVYGFYGDERQEGSYMVTEAKAVIDALEREREEYIEGLRAIASSY